MKRKYISAFCNRFLTIAAARKNNGKRASSGTWLRQVRWKTGFTRGSHPILASMSLQVYAMWVYRVEKGHRNPQQKPTRRFIDLPFTAHYSLHGTHEQRLASEFRVPLFESFTMPSQLVCSETAALVKQLLLRPLSVRLSEEPADTQLVEALDQ